MIRFYDHGYGHFNARHAIDPSCWNWFDLLWVHSGRVAIRFMGRVEQRFDANEGVLIYPHTPFEGRALSASSRASIQHFAITGPQKQLGLLRPFRRLVGKRKGYDRHTLHDADTFDDLVSSAMKLAAMKQTPLVHDLRVAQLALVLGELALAQQHQPRPGPHQDRLAALLQKIHQNPERSMSLPQMADAMALSVSHFRALFRKRLGVSPGQYQQQVRMNEAARMLRDTAAPIKTIARELGFDELANFYRSFKAAHGQTPARYRRARLPRA